MDMTVVTDFLLLVLAAVGTVAAAKIIIPATIAGWKHVTSAVR